MVVALHLHSQDQAEDQQSEPIEQQYMKNNDMPSDANIEELWNELNEIQQPHVQETAVSLLIYLYASPYRYAWCPLNYCNMCSSNIQFGDLLIGTSVLLGVSTNQSPMMNL